MEEGIEKSFDAIIKENFKIEEVNLSEYSPLTLAYIGDCVYDLVIKTINVGRGNKQVNKLHEETSHLVNAKTQSLMMRTIQEMLTQEEHDVFKRGRNTKSVSTAKNQSVTDYRRATGFEALIGYLYLKHEYGRIVELIKIGLSNVAVEDNNE
ncbi:MAG: Mini-ribonuclease 3 [Suipraeoptans sp.]